MKKINNNIIFFTFFIILSCGKGLENSSQAINFENGFFSGGVKPKQQTAFIQHITLEMTTADHNATISTDHKLNQGQFQGKEGSYSFKVTIDTKNLERSYTTKTTFTNLSTSSLNIVNRNGLEYSIDLIPSLYILEVIVKDNAGTEERRLKTSLVVQCANSIKDFSVNPSALKVTPVMTLAYGSSLHNVGIYNHDLSQVVSTTSSLSDFTFYTDRQGDSLFDDVQIRPITQSINFYSTFADAGRQLRYRVYDKCFNFEDFKVNPANAFGPTEKENGDIDSNSSVLPLITQMNWVQSHLVQTGGQTDPRINGTLSFINHNAKATVTCQVMSSTINVVAKESKAEAEMGINPNLTGEYEQIISIKGLKIIDGEYKTDSATFGSLNIAVPGEGDNKVAKSVSTTNCTFEVKMPVIQTTTTPCSPPYEGEGYTVKRQRIMLGYSCPSLTNPKGDATKVEWGELNCNLSAGVKTGKCIYNNPNPNPNPPNPNPPVPGPVPTPPAPNPPAPGVE